MTRLNRLPRPTSMVVMGGAAAVKAVEATQALRFQGPIWPVHPTRDEVAGLKCYRSLDDLPGVPDAAFVGVNRNLAIEAVRQLSALGVGGAVVHASGFSESGSDGDNYGARLIDAAGSMPVIGPNCLGLINYLDGAALWSDLHRGEHVERGIGLLTQSGALAQNVTMQVRALPIAMVINLGNQLIVDVGDCIEAMVKESRISVIAVHLEGVVNVASLDQALRKARRARKPVVILKSGKSPEGVALTMTHTASLSGSSAVFGAFAERAGAVEVDSIVELMETAKLLDMFGPLEGSDAIG